MQYHSQTPEYSTVTLFIQLGDTEWQWMGNYVGSKEILSVKS